MFLQYVVCRLSWYVLLLLASLNAFSNFLPLYIFFSSSRETGNVKLENNYIIKHIMKKKYWDSIGRKIYEYDCASQLLNERSPTVLPQESVSYISPENEVQAGWSKWRRTASKEMSKFDVNLGLPFLASRHVGCSMYSPPRNDSSGWSSEKQLSIFLARWTDFDFFLIAFQISHKIKKKFCFFFSSPRGVQFLKSLLHTIVWRVLILFRFSYNVRFAHLFS